MRKNIKRIFAIILVVSVFLSTNSSMLTYATEQKDVFEEEQNPDTPTTDMFVPIGDEVEIESVDEGARLIFNRESPGWSRIECSELFDTRDDGAEIEIQDIGCAHSDYSVAIKFGNTSGWYDTKGYMLVYSSSGDLAVVWTETPDLAAQENIVLKDVREPLEDDLKVKLQLKGNNYILVVNEKSYTFSATRLDSPESVSFVFGSIGDGNLENFQWDNNFLESSFSFTIAKMSNIWVPGSYNPIGEELTNGNVVGMTDAGEFMEFHESDEGIQVAALPGIESWWRTHFTSNFNVGDGEKIHVVLNNFQSEDDNYSMVVRFGNITGYWWDGPGYMICYGKSGNLAIIGTDGVTLDPNKSDVLAKDKREPITDKLVIDVELIEDSYIFTVNGKSYTIPITYLSNPKSLCLGFGAWEDGEIQSLNYNKNFKKAAFSFVIGKETYTVNSDVNKSFLPLAKYSSFMNGYKDGTFKPEQAITRKEAILTMAKLLVKKTDIEGTYTTDYKDIKEDDKNYCYYAYMERCGFMPEFGDKLEPQKAITRGEFVELLLDPAHTTDGLAIADVKESNDSYKKICYAITQGIFSLDADGNFNPDESVTRGEAAKAFCVLLGKTTPIESAKKTFSDVTSNTEYNDYITLACNAIPYREETFDADSVDALKDSIQKAIELSKTEAAKVTINLTEDVYKLTRPITIDGNSFGDYEVEIIIKNKKNSTPIISSNLDIKASEFTKVSGKEYYSYQLSDKDKVDGEWPAFRDLYLNGERLQMARTENYVFERTFAGIRRADTEQIKGYDNWIYVDSEVLQNISSEEVGTLELCMNVEWNSKRFRVDKIHGVEEEFGLNQISVKETEWNAYLRGEGNKVDYTDWPYWFENHLAFLDEPGEFYYDSANGVIYFYPYSDTDMKSAVVSYPCLETLFELNDTTGITFEGIIFTGLTSNFASKYGLYTALGGVISGYQDMEGVSENIPAAAILSDYSSHLTVRNCAFDELGTNGVYLRGGNHNTTLKGNSFTDLAMCAAIFGKQSQLWNFEDGQSNLVVDNNYVYNIGTDVPSSPAFHITRTNNIAFTHNSMIHTPYTGLLIGWIRLPSTAITVNHAEVAYNYCVDNLYALNDGAGLYFCGANALQNVKYVFNRVHHNYIKSTGYTKTYNGIYLDMNSSNYLVYKNVIEGFDTAHGPVFNQDHMSDQFTYNNTVRDNFTTKRRITTTATVDRNIQLINNEYFMTAAELPEEAVGIIDSTGQTKQYASSTVMEHTTIVMDVEEPHILIPRQGESAENSVTFTITNNSDKNATYSVINTNKVTEVAIIPSTEALELKAGETGEIQIAFRGGDKSKKEILVDLAVVKDNGWKMQYARVIDIDVTAAVAETTPNVGWVILIATGSMSLMLGLVVTIVIIRKRNKKAKDMTQHIE